MKNKREILSIIFFGGIGLFIMLGTLLTLNNEPQDSGWQMFFILGLFLFFMGTVYVPFVHLKKQKDEKSFQLSKTDFKNDLKDYGYFFKGLFFALVTVIAILVSVIALIGFTVATFWLISSLSATSIIIILLILILLKE